jgi:hypothetical protein
MEILDLGFNDCQELPKMQEYKLELKRSLEIAKGITIRETPNDVDMAICFTPKQAIDILTKIAPQVLKNYFA